MGKSVEIHAEVIEEQRRMLEAAMTVSPNLNKMLREAIFREMKRARDGIVSQIKFNNGDPRSTAHSVKRYVARKYLGGVISIASGARTGRTNNYEPPRKVYPGMKGHRGGTRMPRSQRTNDIMHTADRDFILRFVNAGTIPRYSGGGRIELRGSSRSNFFKMQESGEGYRGAIAPRNFFERYGRAKLEIAVQNISKAIDDAYKTLFNE